MKGNGGALGLPKAISSCSDHPTGRPAVVPRFQSRKLRLYHHYLALKQMQESLAGRSLEEQARQQPQINRAEQNACEQVRREREERVPKEEYRRQGGDQFLVFAHSSSSIVYPFVE